MLPAAPEGTERAASEPGSAWARHRFAWVVAGGMLLATVLTAPTLGRTFWRDEAFSAYFAGQPLDVLAEVIRTREATMGAYYLLLHGWQQFGDGEVWLRLPSLAFAVATIPVAALLARRLFGQRAGTYTAVLMSVSAFLVEYAGEARTYALTMLLAALSAALLVDAVARRGAWRWAAYVLVAVAVVLSHPLAILVLAAHAVSLPALPAAGARRAAAVSVLSAGAIGVTLPAYVALTQGAATSWIPATSLRDLGGFVTHYMGGHVPALPWVACLLFAVWRLVPGMLGAGPSERTWRTALVLAWCAVPVVLLVVLSVVKHAFVDRYLVGVFPAIAILVAAGLAALPRTGLRRAALAVVVAASLVGVVMRIHLTPEPDDARAAAGVVAACADPGDALAYGRSWARVPFGYYLDRLPEPARPDDVAVGAGGSAREVRDAFAREVEPAELERLLQDRRRLWVVDFPADDWHPAPEPMLALEEAGFLTEWVPLGASDFGELRVRLFGHSADAGCPGFAAR